MSAALYMTASKDKPARIHVTEGALFVVVGDDRVSINLTPEVIAQLRAALDEQEKAA